MYDFHYCNSCSECQPSASKCICTRFTGTYVTLRRPSLSSCIHIAFINKICNASTHTQNQDSDGPAIMVVNSAEPHDQYSNEGSAVKVNCSQECLKQNYCILF